jgi:hypothetical protein
VKQSVAGNVTSATGSRSVLVGRIPRHKISCCINLHFFQFILINLLDGFFHLGMSRHSQVVIRAPDGDVLFPPGIFFGKRETIGITQYAFENAVGMILLLF